MACIYGCLAIRLCKMWSSPSDLGAKVSRSITQLIKTHPSVGWVRSDAIPSDELLNLRRKVDELQSTLDQVAARGPAGIENLAHGTDAFPINFSVERSVPKQNATGSRYWVKAESIHSHVELSWDQIFASIAPSFIETISAHEIVGVLNRVLQSEAAPILRDEFPEDRFYNFRIYKEDYDTIRVQLRALGLIATQGDVDKWCLTPFGDQYMTKLLAVKREPATRSPRKTTPKRKKAAN